MTLVRKAIGTAGWVALVVLLTAVARAEDDPPGVARVSVIEGPASYQLRESDEWTGVAINAPLVTGDKLYSGEGGRAEIQLAPGIYARLGAETQLDLVELAADATQVSVPMGRAIIRLRDDPARRHVELDTPTVALTLKRAGSYRVDVLPGGRTTVRVGRGEAVAHVGKDRFELFSQSSAVIEGDSGAATYRPIVYGGEDSLDRWDFERDSRVDSSQSYQHVSSEIYGVEDLDDNGEWEYHRGYGQLWRPTTVQVGWAPYRDGRWVWVEPWGWTWLDYAAWGWAPFHYGRWVRLNRSWYWAPGTVIARPVYSPALVGFYGYGGGYGYGASISVGIGAGYVGWVPLGWGEPCYPWWGGWGGARVGYAWWGGWGGPRVVNNVIIKQKNIYNVHVKDVRHVNRRHPGGFTKVERDGFGRGGRMVPVGERERRGFRAVGGRIGVTPGRSSRRAVQPTREAVGRSARPPGADGRGALRRAGLTEATGSRSGVGGARTIDRRAGRSRDSESVSRGGDRAARTQLTPSRRSTGTSSSRESAVSRGRTGSARAAVGSTDRESVRGGVVPRPPTRTTATRSPSAPRQFARRTDKFIADRPSFTPTRGSRSSVRPSTGQRAGVASGGASSRTSRTSVGRAPSSGSARRSVGASSSRSQVASPRSSRGRGGSARTSVVGRGGTTRVSPGTQASSSSRSRVSTSSRPRARAVVTPPRASSGGGRAAVSRSAPSSPTRSYARGSRSTARGGGSSVSSGGGRSAAGRSFSAGRTGGGRSFGGARAGGGVRGGGGGGRVGIGRR